MTKPSANARAFNGTLFQPKVERAMPAAEPATINGRPWWAVAPRVGLTSIARARQQRREGLKTLTSVMVNEPKT